MHIGWLNSPPRDHQHGIAQSSPVESFERPKQMFLHSGKKRVGRSVENLDGCHANSERPMADQLLHSDFVINNEVGPFHRKVFEQVAHAVAAVEWAPNNMVEAQSRFSIVYIIAEAGREIVGCATNGLCTRKINFSQKPLPNHNLTLNDDKRKYKAAECGS